ncbi:MAG TPA: HlyD family secretion protein [Puia sp.]|uniref:HlyD family secretion protein n=1 Tax=Puia sp. TaxID=2045100 RepID=UPI002C09104E|nr:HlyD family secretion protein [Puia sp.]HVU98598.1 HlyD family secretion protein [Puia sp.]
MPQETEKAKKKAHPGKIVTSLVAVAVLIAGIIYFVNYFVTASQYEETNDAQVETYINPVSARAAGYIQKILFEENQAVRQGDTLVILDDREYRARVQEAEAAVEDAQAQLIVLDHSVSSLVTGTTVNKDQIAAAKARLWRTEQDIRRYDNLIREEAVTRSEYDQVKAGYDVASSEYSASENNLRTSYSKIDELRSRKALLLADMKRKMAELAFARINLGYTVITAPYTGRLGRKVIQEGQQVQVGQPLVSIIDDREKWVTANFKETQVAKMYDGQAVRIEVDALPGKVWHGKIESLSAATGARFSLLPPDNSTGNFVKITQRIPVKIVFTDTALGAVRAGMNVNVLIPKHER